MIDFKNRFTKNNEEDDGDFFDGPDFLEDEKKEKKPQEPVYSPDTPDYWEQDEPKFEHLKFSRKGTFYVILTSFAVLLGLIIAFYLRFCSPYIDGAVAYGYVDHIERRGTVFKTYEGTLINYKDLHDTTRLYKRDFVFTASNKGVATALKYKQQEGKPVKVDYKVYHATLPWRGASKIVITGVSDVDPKTILPPEFRNSTDEDSIPATK